MSAGICSSNVYPTSCHTDYRRTPAFLHPHKNGCPCSQPRVPFQQEQVRETTIPRAVFNQGTPWRSFWSSTPLSFSFRWLSLWLWQHSGWTQPAGELPKHLPTVWPQPVLHAHSPSSSPQSPAPVMPEWTLQWTELGRIRFPASECSVTTWGFHRSHLFSPLFCPFFISCQRGF